VVVGVETDTRTDLTRLLNWQDSAGVSTMARCPERPSGVSSIGVETMRSSSDRVLRVQAQLTDRDRLLLEWLADHRVLTTFQIRQALFGSLDFAQRRLLKLYRVGLVDRFRPLRAGGGSYPWHYVLDQLGGEIVAASRGESPPRRGQTVDRMRRIATSRTWITCWVSTSSSLIWPGMPVPTRRPGCSGGGPSSGAPSRARSVVH
jgi:hypothetical protein